MPSAITSTPADSGGGYTLRELLVYFSRMTGTLADLPCPDSFLRRLDLRWRLAAFGGAILAVALSKTLPALGAYLLLSVLLALVGRLPLRWYGVRITTAGFFLLLFTLPLPFLVEGPGSVWRLGPLILSAYGLRIALVATAKSVTILTLALVLLATASLDAILKAAHALWAPGLALCLTLLTYRYLFVFAQELTRLRVALRLRGYQNRPKRHTYRVIGHIAGVFLVRGYEQAERVGHAMRCRGFKGRFHALTDFRTTPSDVAAFLFITTCFAGIFAWDWLHR